MMGEWANDGTGRFVDVSSADLPFNGAYGSACFGDIDKDGDIDFVKVNAPSRDDNGSRLYLNIGDIYHNDGAVFFDKTNQMLPEHKSANACVLQDFNNDGYLDLLILRNGQNLLYKYDPDTGQFVDITPGYIPAVSMNTQAGFMRDFDKDGFLDIITANWNQAPRLYIGGNDYKFSDVTGNFTPNTSYKSRGIIVGDFDQDDQGLLDVIFINSRQKVSMWMNVGNSHFQDFTDANIPWSDDVGVGAVVGDFDKDGDLDFFENCNGQNRIYVNLNNN